MRLVIYAFKYLIYIAHYVFYVTYACIQFISKPGTRVLFPIMLVALGVWQLGTVVAFSMGFSRSLLGPAFSEPAMAVAVGGMIVAILGFAYLYLSRAVALILGIFPPVSRPLMPLRDLQVQRPADVGPVAVRVAVPRLPKRR